MQFILSSEEYSKLTADRKALEIEIGTAWREKVRAARVAFCEELAYQLRTPQSPTIFAVDSVPLDMFRRVVNEALKKLNDL